MELDRIRQHKKVMEEIQDFATEKLSAIGVTCVTCRYGRGSAFCWECDIALCNYDSEKGE